MRKSSTYTLFVRRYAPFASFGGGFEGDNRSYSCNPRTTARTTGIVTFGGGGRVVASGHAAGSAYVGPWFTRRRLPLGTIEKHTAEVRTTLSSVMATEGVVRFTLHTEGSLPLKDIILRKKAVDVFGGVTLDRAADAIDGLARWWQPDAPRPQGTPDIDTFLDLRVAIDARRMMFEGTLRGDGFPNFPNAEVFVLDAAGVAVGLLDYRTSSGGLGPFHRLYGTGAGKHLARFVRHVGLRADGRFENVGVSGPVIVTEP
jgi:hypothetical protein